jgi:microcin C transport system substrate-binding protein
MYNKIIFPSNKSVNFVIIKLSSVTLSCFFFNIFAFPINAVFQKRIALFEKAQYSRDPFVFEYAQKEAPIGGQLHLGALGSFDSFYPFFLKGYPAQGLPWLHATLMSPNPDEMGVSYPYVAEEVEIEPQKITFNLSPHACFHDHTPITAEDVVFSFYYILKNHIAMRSYYEGVIQAEAPSKNQVIFRLKPEASKEMPLILSEMPILSKSFFSKPQKHLLVPPLGSGPYRIADFKPGQFVLYEKISKWWGDKLSVHQGKYRFQNIRYEYFRDPLILFEAFKSGEVDVFIEPSAKGWVKNYDFPAVKKGAVHQEEFLHNKPVGHPAFVFNTRLPLFQDRLVRKAIAIMLDFEWINQRLFFNAYERTTSFFENTIFHAQGLPSLEEEKVLRSLELSLPILKEILSTPLENFVIFKGNLKEKQRQALKLLEQSGWRLEKGVLKNKNGEPFVFEILITDSSLQKPVQIFRQNLARLGIQLCIKKVSPSEFLVSVKELKFQMAPAQMSYSDVPGQELMLAYGSSLSNEVGTLNLAGIRNKAIDQLIIKILEAKSLEKIKLYARVLDRVLTAFFYGVAQWFFPKMRYAFWNTVQKPEHMPKSGPDLMFWWKKVNERK